MTTPFERQAIDELFEKVEGSAVGITLFTNRYKDDPQALMQLAALIVLDKPIYLLVKRGAVIPEKLRAIVDGIEWYDAPEDLPIAMERILKAARLLE